jgi:hypothetical protein
LSLKLKNSNDYTLKAPRIKLILTDENDTVLNTLELSLSTPESVRVVHPGTLNQWMLPVTFDAALDRMPNGYRIELESP